MTQQKALFHDTIDHKTITELAAHEAPLCVTLTMPCVVSGNQQPQNAIRFKNLLQEATEKLEKIGCRSADIDALLSPLEPHIDNTELWAHQDRGLLICVSKHKHDFYQLPFPVDENVVVDRHFYLRPIVPAFQNRHDVNLLLLSRENPTLITASGVLTPSATPDAQAYDSHTPPPPYSSYSDFMAAFESEKSLQFHTENHVKQNPAQSSSGFHGQGVSEDDKVHEQHIKEYLKKLENWVRDIKPDAYDSTLFVIGDPSLTGLYQECAHSNHPSIHILAQKNPESEDVSHWVEQAHNHLQEQYKDECEEHLATLKRMKETQGESVAEDLDDIVRAAHTKRIDTLFVPQKPHDYHWGRYDAESHSVNHQTQDEKITGAGDELVNLAVIKTFLNGGKVIPFPNAIQDDTGHKSTAEKSNPQSDGKQPRYAALYRW